MTPGLWRSSGGKWPPFSDPAREIEYQRVKQRIHERVVSCLDMAAAETYGVEEIVAELQPFVLHLLQEMQIELDAETGERLIADLPSEMFGLGPLDDLLQETDVSDILVNRAHEVFVERAGMLTDTPVKFADDQHLLRIIQRIAAQVGRRIDESSPLVDARLTDGSRVNAVIPPLALDGPKLSIRRFRQLFCRLENLVENGTLSGEMACFLRASVQARKSILISGGTGSGKTTMLNALSSCIPANQRVVTIEDSAELQLQHRHVARLETRPANSEQTGEVTQRDLVRNSLRMRPDRIIIGEVRGAEALDMLQAMNTGHEGSLTTIHANSTVDAIGRLEMMVAMTGLDLPHAVVRAYICAGISLLVHMDRLADGRRRLTRISELAHRNGDLQVKDIFAYRRTGLDAAGLCLGHFEACQLPTFLDEFGERGVYLDTAIFGLRQPPAESCALESQLW